MNKNQEGFDQAERSNLIAVGIDVSKDTLAVCERFENKDEMKEIKNNKTEIEKLIKEISRTNYRGHIVMESTGRHHLQAALALSKNNLDAIVINPLITKKYYSSSIRKIKTDKKDSQLLAEIALKEENLPESFSAGKNELIVKKKLSLIAFIDNELQKINASVNEFVSAYEELGLKLSAADKKILKTVDALKKQKEELEKETEKLISENSCKADEVKKYSSIPGVSVYAASVLSFFFSKDYNASSKQWIAFSGIDVSVRQSGHWQGKGKLTKRGNSYLRKKLFQAAWGVKTHNEKFKKYYDYLRSKGKSYVEAMIIIARKLVVIMFNLCKKNEYYDASKISFKIA